MPTASMPSSPRALRTELSFDEGAPLLFSLAPLGFAAGDTNLYRYCSNGPTNGIDPTGLSEGVAARPKYINTITVYGGHSQDVIDAAKILASDITTYNIPNAKIAGIGCSQGWDDINSKLRDEHNDIVVRGIQPLPPGIGRSASWGGAGGAAKLPEPDANFLRPEDKKAWETKKTQIGARPAQSEAVNRAFVNSLVKAAIGMLPKDGGGGVVKIHFVQLPEGWNKAFLVEDLAKEAGITNGLQETMDKHTVTWTLKGNDLVGEVR